MEKKDENYGRKEEEGSEGDERSHKKESGWVYTCIVIAMLVVYSALLIPYAFVYNWVLEPVGIWMRKKKKNKR